MLDGQWFISLLRSALNENISISAVAACDSALAFRPLERNLSARMSAPPGKYTRERQFAPPTSRMMFEVGGAAIQSRVIPAFPPQQTPHPMQTKICHSDPHANSAEGPRPSAPKEEWKKMQNFNCIVVELNA
jgi:hypothetical protein